MNPAFAISDLGRIAYAEAYARQAETLEMVVAARGSSEPVGAHVLLVEHDPVITVTRRPGAAEHLLASRELLASMGVALEETDRGGDITYHGPGQLVVYPIVDLNLLNLGLHDYMRLLEESVIRTLAGFGVEAGREAGATGVWVPGSVRGRGDAAKVCAMGVRVRKWVSMHGLALNVSPNLSHFDLIVPCGLAGRPVTSLAAELGERCPTFAGVKQALSRELLHELRGAWEAACQKRDGRVSGALPGAGSGEAGDSGDLGAGQDARSQCS
jgi:lipoyl(octanoyl) transferase